MTDSDTPTPPDETDRPSTARRDRRAHDEADLEDEYQRELDRDAEIGPIGWLLSMLLIGPIRVYQQLISPLLGPCCRFRPTCSEYFIQSVRKHGPLLGAWRGMCRIARCHPFHPGGDDPP